MTYKPEYYTVKINGATKKYTTKNKALNAAAGISGAEVWEYGHIWHTNLRGEEYQGSFYGKMLTKTR